MKFRFCAILLVLLCLLTACATGDSGTSGDTTAAPVADTPETTTGETAGFTYVYPDVKYTGEEFRIFNSEPKYNMIINMTSADMTGEAVNDSMYENKCTLEEQFGITISETYGSFGSGMLTALQTEILSGDVTHDVAYMYSTQVGSLISSGYLTNLYNYDDINIDSEWWNQSLKDDGTLFSDTLYYLVSDAHLMSFEGSWCMYFNMDMFTDLGIDYPYEKVRDGKWTLEALYTIAQSGASLNGDASYDWSTSGRCVYGLASFKNLMNALVLGADLMFCRKDASDTPYYSFPSETALYDKLEAIARITGESGTYISANTSGKHYIDDIFGQGRALLMGGEIKAAANELTDTSFKFGIVPIPKYNEDQQDYHTNMLWSTLLMTIPTSVKNPERTAQIMDAMSYLAMTNTLPVYYDRVSYKGLADQNSIDMLNIISNTRYLNWGLTYNWLKSIEPEVNTQLDAGNASIAPIIKASDKVVNVLIKQTLASLGH